MQGGVITDSLLSAHLHGSQSRVHAYMTGERSTGTGVRGMQGGVITDSLLSAHLHGCQSRVHAYMTGERSTGAGANGMQGGVITDFRLGRSVLHSDFSSA